MNKNIVFIAKFLLHLKSPFVNQTFFLPLQVFDDHIQVNVKVHEQSKKQVLFFHYGHNFLLVLAF